MVAALGGVDVVDPTSGALLGKSTPLMILTSIWREDPVREIMGCGC
jgi:hypothetical protein